jgi:hypothetical protein
MLSNKLAGALPATTARSNGAAPSTAMLPAAVAMLPAAAEASAARPLAGHGPGAAACATAWIAGGYGAGIAGGAGQASGGYAPAFADAVQPPKVRLSATDGSNAQSTVQHNTMTRLIPVQQGGVGPHPAREPEPA